MIVNIAVISSYFVVKYTFPTLYSLVICLTGYIAYGIVQTLLVLPLALFNIVDDTSDTQRLFVQAASAVVVLLLSLWINMRKIGFMFIARKFKFNSFTSGNQYMFILLISLFIVAMQIAIESFDSGSSIIFILMLLMIIFSFGIHITYQKNKRDLLDKYNKTKVNYDR